MLPDPIPYSESESLSLRRRFRFLVSRFLRTFRRIYNEIDTASMPAKMRRAARARLDQVNSEYQRATRVVERLLQAHGGEYRGDQKRRNDFRVGRAPAPRWEDPIPMERRPTLHLVTPLQKKLCNQE